MRCLPRPFTLPSSRIEALGQHRVREVAHPQCQSHRHVVALVRLQPSTLWLPVRRRTAFKLFAVGAVPRLSISERSRAKPTALSTSFINISSIPYFWCATVFLDLLAFQRRLFESVRLASHLLQHAVDERASEHVEKVGSNPSIDP